MAIARGAALAVIPFLAACATVPQPGSGLVQPELGARVKPVLTVDGLRFRDLDADGRLSPFEDWRNPDGVRADDLLARMTVEEKAGTLFHATLPSPWEDTGQGMGYQIEQLAPMIDAKRITSFITRLSTAPEDVAAQNNAVQQLAEDTRLGIPLTISSDPRNHFQYVLGASETANGASQWPELPGFAALGDAERMHAFGDAARREYRAVGIHMALSPQLDIATEPRWPRAAGTFGSDAATASRLGAAYVAGMQGGTDGLADDGVITVAKHWVGYGAAPDGFDGHNYHGRFMRPGTSFDRHVEAFEGALNVKVAGIMPAYPVLVEATIDGKPVTETVAAGYSRLLLQDLLRGKLGYDGFILSDWGITSDCNERCSNPTEDAPQRGQDIATSWGVEDLSVAERYAAGMAAGIDQFGGTDDVAPMLEAIRSGAIPMERVDDAVRRMLLPKFQLGLFENPYVDPAAARSQVGTAADVALAERTQREAQVLLKKDRPLSLAQGAKVWLVGMDADAARAAGLVVVDDPSEADLAIVRTDTPSEMLHPYSFFGSRQKEGRLDFRPGDPAWDALVRAREAGTPTALAIFLDRAAVLTGIMDKADIVLANFGANDGAVLDVLAGKVAPRGRLPMELPRSMEAVIAQDPGAPDDSADPLFPRGFGL